MPTPPDTAVKTLDDLLNQALIQGASDIHLESGENFFRARFRVDGLLRLAATPAMTLRDAIVSRLKVLARIEIAEKRLPQDGRIQYPFQGQVINVRVSSLPTLHGEKIVVRILNFSRELPELAALGYEPDDRAKLLQAIEQPHGLILMTGPTGSGKSLARSTTCLKKPLNTMSAKWIAPLRDCLHS
jgi:type IV pilus assembly protein PilB